MSFLYLVEVNFFFLPTKGQMDIIHPSTLLLQQNENFEIVSGTYDRFG